MVCPLLHQNYIHLFHSVQTSTRVLQLFVNIDFTCRVPPNVSFQIDDATMSWTFPTDHFDYIHVRCMGGTITDWPTFLSYCFKYVHRHLSFCCIDLLLSRAWLTKRQTTRHLKPGGIVELSEGRTHMECDDGTYPEDCYTRRWIVCTTHAGPNPRQETQIATN